MLNVRHLAVFRAVIKAGSVSAAARTLHISQPAVTKTVRLLEDEIGLPLFARVKGRLVSTPESEALLPEIERLFGNVEAVKHLADEIREGFSGSVSIATVATLSATLVASTIKRFHKLYPGVRFDIKALSTRHVIDFVANNQVDVGILDVPATGVDLEVMELCRSEVGCIMRPDHPLTARKSLRPRDLASETLISFAEDTVAGWALREAFHAAGLHGHITFTVNHTLSAYALVEAGVGLGVVDAFPMLSGAHPSLVIRPFRPVIETRPRVVFSKGRPVSLIARKFVAELVTVMADLIAGSGSMLKRP
jgi:DNA-binding transcriptional LysR family regulator